VVCEITGWPDDIHLEVAPEDMDEVGSDEGRDMAEERARRREILDVFRQQQHEDAMQRLEEALASGDPDAIAAAQAAVQAIEEQIAAEQAELEHEEPPDDPIDDEHDQREKELMGALQRAYETGDADLIAEIERQLEEEKEIHEKKKARHGNDDGDEGQGDGPIILIEDAAAGSKCIQTNHHRGLSEGDPLIINAGYANEEEVEVEGFGSIVLKSPLQQAHQAGEEVVVDRGPGGQHEDPVQRLEEAQAIDEQTAAEQAAVEKEDGRDEQLPIRVLGDEERERALAVHWCLDEKNEGQWDEAALIPVVGEERALFLFFCMDLDADEVITDEEFLEYLSTIEEPEACKLLDELEQGLQKAARSKANLSSKPKKVQQKSYSFQEFYDRQVKHARENDDMKAILREQSLDAEMCVLQDKPKTNKKSKEMVGDQQRIYYRYPEVKQAKKESRAEAKKNLAAEKPQDLSDWLTTIHNASPKPPSASKPKLSQTGGDDIYTRNTRRQKREKQGHQAQRQAKQEQKEAAATQSPAINATTASLVGTRAPGYVTDVLARPKRVRRPPNPDISSPRHFQRRGLPMSKV